MSAPTAPLAVEYYEALGYGQQFFADQDADNGYAAGVACTAEMAAIEVAGRVAANPRLWSDPVNAPDELIRNMAMRAGLRNAGAETIARLRNRLANPPAFETGSTPAIAEAVRGLLLNSLADVSVDSNTHPVDGSIWGHTTVTVDPDDVGTATLEQIQLAAEQAAPDWIVIHAVVAEGLTIDELTDDIDDLTGPISEL